MDLEALLTDELREQATSLHVECLNVESSTRAAAREGGGKGRKGGARGLVRGDGPIDAIFRAINVATGVDARLREFHIGAVTGGQDALGRLDRGRGRRLHRVRSERLDRHRRSCGAGLCARSLQRGPAARRRACRD